MRSIRIVLAALVILSFSALVYAVEGPKAEIERYDFQRPMDLKPKITEKKSGPPMPPLPPIIKEPKDHFASDLQSAGLDSKLILVNTGFPSYGGASVPMMNSTTAISQTERMITKIERVIKKLNL